MMATTHPASIALQLLLTVVEFWAIGQYHKHPLRFTVGMAVLNGLYVVFHCLVGSFILGLICLVMAYRHGVNARRVARMGVSAQLLETT